MASIELVFLRYIIRETMLALFMLHPGYTMGHTEVPSMAIIQRGS